MNNIKKCILTKEIWLQNNNWKPEFDPNLQIISDNIQTAFSVETQKSHKPITINLTWNITGNTIDKST